MNTAFLGLSSVIVHESMIGSHRWKKTGKIADFFHARCCQGRGQERSEPVSVEHRSVEYSRSHTASYLKIGW